MQQAVHSLRVVISSEARLLHILRCVVRYRAQDAGVAPPDVDSMAMAIDEAASNIIRHTYGDRPDARLALEIRTFPDHLEFLMEDSGPKVPPGAWQPRALDEIRPGGLGTYFINRFMDGVSYDDDFPGGNRLRLVKYFSPQGSTSDEGAGQERR
jgi:anti-sigma regulatory factor (Ser/Thr protein kinase)